MTKKVVPYVKNLNKDLFDCEIEPLTKYLKTQASQDVKKKVSACYCLVDDENKILGYYTLSNYSLDINDLPSDYNKKLPKYDQVPLVMLGRLAIDKSIKGQKYGSRLLIDALLKALNSSEIIGSFGVIVDPINENAEKFYDNFGFIKIPDNGKMILSMETIKKLFHP